MRATFGRIALITLVAIGLSGCSSGSNMFAWLKKKPSNTALTEAPKYNPSTASNPSLPSAGQNPNNSLTSAGNTAWPSSNATAGAATGANSYMSSAQGYQPSSYPSTSYGQAKLTPASGATANPWGTSTPSASNAGVSSSGFVSGGFSSATPGFSASNTNPTSSYASANPASYSNPTTTTTPNPTISSVQPQSGYYNPAYEGGTSNRYASGASIPATVNSTVPASPPTLNSSSPSYYTADARNTMTGAASGNGTNNSPYNAATGYTNPAASTNNASAYQPTNNYQAAPTGYTPGNTGYQPGVTSNPPGNTGYNPTDAYSAPSTAGTSAGAGSPARIDTEYRPGGTSNYVPTTGNTLQPAGGNAPQENRAPPSGVMPASYQSPVSSTSGTSEVYGAYQGSGANKEPAYGASNPSSASSGTTRTW